MKLNRPDLLRQQAYINGEWVSANQTHPIQNPATGEVLAQVPDMGADETRAAIEAAHAAFQTWKQTTAGERAAKLRKWFDLQLAHQEDLAQILTAEQGKPLAEALGEIRYGASYVEWFAEEARRVYGDVIPGHEADKRILVVRQPVGVVGIITPWNFPNAMMARKIAPALAAGCTVVVKPAEATPLSALALAVLAEEAGIPKGVINMVTTGSAPAIGSVLTSHPHVRKISFTGSTAVGKLLMKQCADTMKRITMELGGNAPFIVFDDADVDEAVVGAMISKYRNAGQTCVCANRIYVQKGIADAFIPRFTEAVEKLRVGEGTQEGVTIGPLINDKAISQVETLLQDALNKGAQITLGGGRHALGGTFFEPTVVTGVTAEMDFSKREIFGPIAPVYIFETEEEVIQMANDTEFGLASYFYGRDIGRIFRVAEALEYGMVGINTGLISTAVAPFGGVKESGFGREGSKYGIQDYLEMKYMCIGGIR